ncbi:MAG: hypothetical protein QOE43_1861 [Gaiellaceae bacterium]|jgi:hypothetical protein|nr:hypothetical protein [Gaiellaceae bacterium]
MSGRRQKDHDCDGNTDPKRTHHGQQTRRRAGQLRPEIHILLSVGGLGRPTGTW